MKKYMNKTRSSNYTQIIRLRKSTLLANVKVEMISQRFNCVTIYAQNAHNNKLQVSEKHRVCIHSGSAADGIQDTGPD